MRGHPWDPVTVQCVPIWEHTEWRASLRWLREAQLPWSHAPCSALTGSGALHTRGSAHAKYMLRAWHMLWLQAMPNHTGNTPRALQTLCLQERSIPASPTPTPHFISLSQPQAVQTSNLLLIITLSPLCPGKGGWARGPGPACTPISSGADPSPSWAGSWGHSIRPAGAEIEVGQQGRAREAMTGHTEAGARGQGPEPRISGSAGALQASACLPDRGLTAGDRYCPRCRLRCQGRGCKGSPSPSGKRPPAGSSGPPAHSASPAARCPPSP